MLSSLFPPEFINIALKRALPILLLNKLCFFCIYKYTKNACVIDVGYTFGHFLAGACYAYYAGDIKSVDTKIKLLLLALWTLRLGGFLWKNRIMKGYHDPRYEDIFKKYPPGTLSREGAVFGQYIFQGLIVLVTSSPLFWTFKNQLAWNTGQLQSVRGINYVSLLVVLVSIILEGIADQQLQTYKENRAQYKQGHIFQEGLWQKSRHPNLLFELATWIGFATSGIFSAGDVAALVGPFALFLVMDKLTVPITEKYMRKTRGDKYKSFIQSTNKYWPL